jgi:hypothetical protein
LTPRSSRRSVRPSPALVQRVPAADVIARPRRQPLPRKRVRSVALFGHRSISDLSSQCASKPTSADAYRFMDSRPCLPRLLALPRQPNLLKRFNVICPTGSQPDSLSSPSRKNIPLHAPPKSKLYPSMSRPTEGRFAIVTNVGQGCGGRGSVLRATGSQGGLAKGP